MKESHIRVDRAYSGSSVYHSVYREREELFSVYPCFTPRQSQAQAQWVDLEQREATLVLLVQFQSILFVCVSYVCVQMVSGAVTRGNKERGFTLPL